MNRNVFKMIYYKDGKALKYWYEKHNISITNATIGDSGNYYCTGILWQINYTSDPLKITVKEGELGKGKGRSPLLGNGEKKFQLEIVTACKMVAAVIS